MKLNFGDLEMQIWNIPKDRAQRLNEENVFIYLVIMFTPRVIVIKMSKTVHFFVYPADVSKKSVTVSAKYLLLWTSPRPATSFKKRPWHRCYPANFVKFLWSNSGRLLLKLLLTAVQEIQSGAQNFQAEMKNSV